MSYFLQPHELQHAKFSCPSPSPGVFSHSYPLSRWCHPTISPSVTPFFFCPQSFPASGSFPMSQPFASGGQSIGALASVKIPVNIQLLFFRMDWLDLLVVQGTLKSLLSTTVWKHQFFGAQFTFCRLIFGVIAPRWPFWRKTPVSCHFCMMLPSGGNAHAFFASPNG